MPLAIIFWIIMLVWLLFGAYNNRAAIGPWASNRLVDFVLFALLGWAVFGAAVHR